MTEIRVTYRGLYANYTETVVLTGKAAKKYKNCANATNVLETITGETEIYIVKEKTLKP